MTVQVTHSFCINKFEAKHSYFKGLSQSVKNFPILPYLERLGASVSSATCKFNTNQCEFPGAGLIVGPSTCTVLALSFWTVN